MNKKLLIFTIFLLIFASITSWLTIKSVKKTVIPHQNQLRNPDGFILNTTYTQMDKNGLIHSAIFVPQGRHYQLDDTTVFNKPRITIYHQQQKPWQVTANHGDSKHGTKIIKLIGNVKLHQAASKHNKELDVTTPTATLFTQQKIIKTDKQVIIKQPGLKIKAIGAIANIKNKTLKLLSHVEETYDPTR